MTDTRVGERVAVAVDLGGTKVEAALVTESGQVLAGSAHRRPTGRATTPASVGVAITDVIGAAISAVPDAVVVGVGIGAAGPLDLAAGTVSPLNMPGLAGFAIEALVRESLPGVPVMLRLDGTCIALAEHLYGAARGSRHSVSMVVSTGVGGGLIVGGRLVSGATGNAGHIGQLRLRPARPGAPAHDGTLESIAAGPPTVAWAQRHGFPGDTGEQLAAGYARGDAVPVAAVRRSAAAVGSAIATVATLLNLEVVVVAGGFVAVAADYVDLVRAAAAEAALFPYARAVRIEPSGLEGHGPLVGAALLVWRPDLLD